MVKIIPPLMALLVLCTSCQLEKNTQNPVRIQIEIADNLMDSLDTAGRLFLFISENKDSEPRRQLWPMSTEPNHIFARNMNWTKESPLVIQGKESWDRTAPFDLKGIPNGTYSFQVVWDQDDKESRIDAPGNLHSEVYTLEVNDGFTTTALLSQQIPPRRVNKHPLVETYRIKSELLSGFRGRDIYYTVSLLLPATFHDQPSRTYPVRYNISGYGGRYTRINQRLEDPNFLKWWMSERAPQVINVYLDGEGPYGDNYHLDSKNNGPYGQMLTKELIPQLEAAYRGKQDPTYRFVDGCSTGGWVSLALQLFYPDMFNGVWSYSPDAITFSDYQLIDIYQDENAFTNEWGNPHPLARDLSGDPIVFMETFIRYENVLAPSGTYINSGGQFSAHNALYSPKGADGLPQPMFDPETGAIDKTVVAHWRQYDLGLLIAENWAELGPKLQDKIYIWMGDMDNFFLNPATRTFANIIQAQTQPTSNAVIEFTPMAGHCDAFGDKVILEQIKVRLSDLGI